VDSEALVRENVELQTENQRLKAELAELKRLIHGSKRERFVPAVPPEQLALFGDLEKAIEEGKKETQKITYERKKPRKEKPFRNTLPEDLPREEVIIEPDFDTEGMVVIGKEVTEELDYVPASFKVFCYIRFKYADPKNGDAGIRIADMPARPIDKGIAGPGLLARILVNKFCDHLPFYRQQKVFSREGFDIPSSTLEGWFARTCNLLEPLYEELRRQVLTSDYLQADETPIKVLDKQKKGKTHRGYHWIYHAPEKKLALFDYRPGRGRTGPAAILQDFKGWLQTDGYSVYEDFEKRSGIQLVGCLAHARRYFERALETHPEAASQMLKWMQQLYAVERKAREYQLTAEQRKALRQEEALRVIDQIGKWMVEQHKAPDFLPKDLMGKAFTYLLHRFNYITRYLQDGRLEIDNNLAENLIRPIAIGRKNYLFAGSHKGAQRAAMAYSLLACCKLNDVNPFDYLRDVISRMPNHSIQRLEELMPGKWESEKT
jgi:transposase